MKQKLNAKDFILIGILTALMWIISNHRVHFDTVADALLESYR